MRIVDGWKQLVVDFLNVYNPCGNDGFNFQCVRVWIEILDRILSNCCDELLVLIEDG